MKFQQIIAVVAILSLSLSAVSSMELECSFLNSYFCWNSDSKSYEKCWTCKIENAELLSKNESVEISTGNNEKTNSAVEQVQFYSGNVKYLPGDLTKIFPNMKNIFLTNTQTEIISSEFFQNMEQLKFFNSENSFLLEDRCFASTKNLEAIDLGLNKLTSIPSNAFAGLTKLVELVLIVNNLEAVDSLWFQDLQKLEKLNLFANNIKTLEDNVFNNLKNLKNLNLRENDITTISGSVFAENLNLEIINLDGNKIFKIDVIAFRPLKHLRELHLNNNQCVHKIFINSTIEEIEQDLNKCQPK